MGLIDATAFSLAGSFNAPLVADSAQNSYHMTADDRGTKRYVNIEFPMKVSDNVNMGGGLTGQSFLHLLSRYLC
jgi:hypothetical protein